MAGGYNANLFKCLESRPCRKRLSWYLPIGKKAVEYCQHKGIEMLTEEFAVVADISVADCFAIAKILCEDI